jgi:hypothetical protein
MFQIEAQRGAICPLGQCPLRVKLRRTQYEQMSSGLPLKADIAQCSRHVSKVPTSEVPVATLRRRQKAELFSRSIRQTRTRRIDASAIGYVRFLAKVSPPKYRRARALAVNSTSRSLCRTGAMPAITQAAPPMRLELRRPLATGPMQKRIHGLS